MTILESIESANIASPTQPLFYIQNKGTVGNCLRWWRPEGNGYTSNLDDAWKVTATKAAQICRWRPHEDIAWPAADVDELCQRHVMAGALERLARIEAS